eukprot:842774_1
MDKDHPHTSAPVDEYDLSRVTALGRIDQTYLLRRSQIDVVEHFPSQIEAPRVQRTALSPVQIPRRHQPTELQIAVTPPVDYSQDGCDSKPEIITPTKRLLAQHESRSHNNVRVASRVWLAPRRSSFSNGNGAE